MLEASRLSSFSGGGGAFLDVKIRGREWKSGEIKVEQEKTKRRRGDVKSSCEKKRKKEKMKKKMAFQETNIFFLIYKYSSKPPLKFVIGFWIPEVNRG